MTTHDLKVHPEYFAALADGSKPFEARKDDRGYAVGDVLHLREWSPRACSDYHQRGLIAVEVGADDSDEDEILARATEAAYTGRSVRRVVTYVLRGGPWLADGYVVLGLADARVAALEAAIAEHQRLMAAGVVGEAEAVLRRASE